MIPSISRHLNAILLAAVAVQLPIQAAGGQSHGPTVAQLAHRVRVTVALADSLADPRATAMIYRRASQTPHDVIVMARSRATGDVLNAAIAELLAARELQGDTARFDNVMRVTRSKSPNAWSAHDRAFSSAMVAKLFATRVHNIGGIGRMPADEVYLRPKAFRGKLTAKPKR